MKITIFFFIPNSLDVRKNVPSHWTVFSLLRINTQFTCVSNDYAVPLHFTANTKNINTLPAFNLHLYAYIVCGIRHIYWYGHTVIFAYVFIMIVSITVCQIWDQLFEIHKQNKAFRPKQIYLNVVIVVVVIFQYCLAWNHLILRGDWCFYLLFF